MMVLIVSAILIHCIRHWEIGTLIDTKKPFSLRPPMITVLDTNLLSFIWRNTFCENVAD